MARTPRQSLKDLLDRETEKPILENLYRRHGVATDQLRREPDVLEAITVAFNRLTSRELDRGTILRYMLNRRKETDWPTLGRQAQKFSTVSDLFTDAQIEDLKQIYLGLDVPSDEFLFRPKLVSQVSRLFTNATGKNVSGSILVALIVAKRKRGEWPRIRETQAGAFADIDAVARRYGTGA